MRAISRDTTLCMSLAARSGQFGTRFHNHLYAALGLDYVYKAFTTTDLPAAIAGIRALGIRGCAISMPFKEACIPLLDALEDSAAAIDAVNTIVNDAGRLRGYNTDYVAVRQLLREHAIDPATPVLLRGSGGMAKAVGCALRDAGFGDGVIIARNEAAGRRLAQSCGYVWRAEAPAPRAALLVNVTPVGMAGGAEADALAFDEATIEAAARVFDVVALPAETPLIRRARQLGIATLSGAEVSVRQALEQFVLYTGVRPDAAQVAAAAAYARGG